MKKLGVILAAVALFLGSASASAQQFGSPRDYGYGYGRHITFLGGGMTHFHAAISPLTLTYKSNGVYSSTHGLSMDAGMASMIPLAPAAPVYAEVGFGAQYSFGNLAENTSLKLPATAFGIKIPVNFTYVLDFGPSVALMPYVGAGLLANISGTVKADSVKFDLYDDASPVEGNRFVLGGQLGCRLAVNRFLLGVGYERSFTNVAKHVGASQVAISLGVIL
ncbi:MAG: hypothetical protein MJY83_05185 [Bacteroidales bacterium]|nr:hypothetical protein [Bacteroidales bacterium]